MHGVNGPTPRLDVVLLDVDDTLYSTTEFAQKARRWAVRAMIEKGFDADEDLAYEELSELVAEFSSNYEHHFERLIERLGPERLRGHNPAVVVAAGVVAYHRTKRTEMELLPDARALLDALKTARVRTGVISAGFQVKQAEKLIRLRVLPYLDPGAIFFSDQMGVGKPNPKIYAKACEDLGIEPARAIYVGDRPDHDVAPAAAAGLYTVLYRGAGGKYATATGPIPPDHDLTSLEDLVPILHDAYGLPVGLP